MKTTIRGVFNIIFLAAAILAVIIFAWIGAEYTFEESVSFGVVDACFACVTTFFVMKDIFGFANRKGGVYDGKHKSYV